MADVTLEGLAPEAVSGLALLAKSLSEDPKTRADFLRLTKVKNPELSIPEVDMPDQFQKMLSDERTKREALEAKIREDEVRREIMQKREQIKAKGISEKDVAEVEKMMTEKGIANHETAAEFYLAQQKLATPTAPQASPYQPMQLPKVDAKEFGGNMRSWAKNEAGKMFAGIRNGTVQV